MRWFTREQVRAAAAAEGDDDAAWERGDAAAELLLPPRLAIARRLLDGWLGDDG